MADNAISGINPYYMPMDTALMNDPYFLAAYKSPNNYQLAAAQAQQGQAAGQTAPAATTVPQGQVTQPQTAEKSSNKGLAAGLILSVGATALCIAAHGKGNKNLDFIPRIGDGFKNMWKSVTKTVGEKLGKTAETFKIAEKNGQKVCNIPGRNNRLYGANLVEDLGKIGQTAEIKPLMNESHTALAEGSNLRRYTFMNDDLEVTVVKGKLAKIIKGGEDVTTKYTKAVNTTETDVMKTLNEKIAKYNKGENIADLTNIRYSNTENGVSRLYSITKAGEEPELISVVTKDFAIDSKTVNAIRDANPKVNEFLTAYEKGELKISDLSYGKLPTDIGTFVVKQNGEIVEIITKDNKHLKAGTEDFLNLQHLNKEIFENVPKNYASFTERAYAMAA